MSPPRKTSEVVAKLDKFCRLDDGTQAKDGGSPPSPGAPAMPSTEQRRNLDAILQCQTTLTSKLEKVKMDISLLCQDLQNLRGRVSEAEDRQGRVEDDLPPCPECSGTGRQRNPAAPTQTG